MRALTRRTGGCEMCAATVRCGMCTARAQWQREMRALMRRNVGGKMCAATVRCEMCTATARWQREMCALMRRNGGCEMCATTARCEMCTATAVETTVAKRAPRRCAGSANLCTLVRRHDAVGNVHHHNAWAARNVLSHAL